MKGYFEFVRVLFLQKLSFYDMNWIENRTQDKVFMRMSYWSVQSQGSKSEEERSVRQREGWNVTALDKTSKENTACAWSNRMSSDGLYGTTVS